ncbi:MAG: hypothetical protein V3S22_02915 [Candidatus Neomarinimicrobiota bacterium]
MADLTATVGNVVSGLVNLIKGLIVLFIFASIAWPEIPIDAVAGLMELVDSFLNGGFVGLLALLLLVSFLD